MFVHRQISIHYVIRIKINKKPAPHLFQSSVYYITLFIKNPSFIRDLRVCYWHNLLRWMFLTPSNYCNTSFFIFHPWFAIFWTTMLLLSLTQVLWKKSIFHTLSPWQILTLESNSKVPNFCKNSKSVCKNVFLIICVKTDFLWYDFYVAKSDMAPWHLYKQWFCKCY